MFAELKSNHEQNREPRPLGADVDRLDWHQAFFDFGRDRAGLLRLGRQELVYGSGRRIFPRNGPNVRGKFDGLRGVAPLTDVRLEAFAFRPVEVDPGVFDDSTIDTQTFWGVYSEAKPPGLAPWSIDVYYIGARRLGARFNQGVATEQRHSIGTRFLASPAHGISITRSPRNGEASVRARLWPGRCRANPVTPGQRHTSPEDLCG